MKVVLFLFLLTFTVRSLFLMTEGVSFHYDMSRDAFLVQEIIQGDPKIQGPPTSTPGLYHGVAYYYLLVPGYLLGGGDPKIASVWLLLINSTAVIPIYLLSKGLLRNKFWATIAGILFATSFQATQYGPWLSNPSPVLVTSAWFFYSLWLWQKGHRLGLPLACFWAALSCQFQLFMLYLFILIPIFGCLFKINVPNKKTLIISAMVTAVVLSTFVMSAVKFNSFNQTVQGFNFISETKNLEWRPMFIPQFINYLNKLADTFIYNLLPTNVFLGGLLGFLIVYLNKSQPFIIFTLLSSLIIFLFGGHNSNYANIGLISSVIIATTFVLKSFKSKSGLLFFVTVSVILYSNITTIISQNPKGQTLLVIPDDMNLKNQLALIDKTYQIADGGPFYINNITVPLWTNTTWAYLYSWYGKDKYGYLPIFYGPNQINLLGDGVLERTDQPLSISFLIIEPPEGIPSQILAKELEIENYKTKLINEEIFGSIKLQVRFPVSSTALLNY